MPPPPPSRGTVQLIAVVDSCESHGPGASAGETDAGTCELVLEKVTAYGASVPQLAEGARLDVRRLELVMSDIREGIRIQAELALRVRASPDGEIRYWDALSASALR